MALSCFPKAVEIFGLSLLSVKNQMAQLNLKRMVKKERGGEQKDSASL